MVIAIVMQIKQKLSLGLDPVTDEAEGLGEG
jgi:hypothetical protein